MHIQMARAFEMNPDIFGKLANHRQELWKLSLPDFIEQLYRNRQEAPPRGRARGLRYSLA